MSHPRTAAAPAAPAEPAGRAHVPPGVILAIACVANFMVIIDTSIVNVALPAMKAALGLSAADQQWVVDGYLITFGGFLLVAARAGDLFGRKGVFQAGLLVFTAASLAGGLAQDPWLLIAARVLQGIGAAALASSSLSLITASHPEGPARTHALSLWAAVGSSAGAVGVVLGGLLTTELSWRYVLFINVPIGVALLTAAAASLVPSPARRDWARLDLPGALTVTVGAGSAVYAVSQATIKGWGSTPVIAALAAAAILLAAFGMIEARSAAPLVPLSIFGQRSLAVGNTVMACLGVVMTSGFFFLSLYLQQILGYSALRTGAAIVPMTVLLAAGPLAAKRLLPRFGPRFLTLAGGILTTAGVAWMSLLPDQSDYPPASSAPCWSSAPASGSCSSPSPHPPRPASRLATPGSPPACSTRRASSAAPSASPCSSPSPPPPPATATSPAPLPPPSTATASPCSSARPSAWPRSSLPSSCPPRPRAPR